MDMVQTPYSCKMTPEADRTECYLPTEIFQRFWGMFQQQNPQTEIQKTESEGKNDQIKRKSLDISKNFRR